MKTYRVLIEQVVRGEVYVTARNAAEAKQQALDGEWPEVFGTETLSTDVVRAYEVVE